ncbi:exopolysaccharide biosynthesis protein [Clostridium aestuarii]|uniref:protein-tyrosine-phosphatase n=1 Tax=Clostridium aestuarii TaxID=338193 RepID=A0ABT4CZG3_9CLOT|nr:CpsB/CapC family capsule biosynthesis tyrosine phosphatase [Clostridium aestuarii]MCY6484374.1 exopolysaccharide biosynthesis protein [Clostridium aestuarii]
MTLDMIKIAEGDGIKEIIATPHFYRHHYENAYEDVVNKVNDLKKIAKQENIALKIYPGQEIFLDKYTIDLYKQRILNGLNGTKYMLIEFSMDNLPDFALDTIYELRLLDVVPIIAHPERYVYVYKDPCILNDFINEGCLFQINSSSIIGLHGKKVQKSAKTLIKNGICDFIGSDAHSNRKRAPKIKDGLEFIKENNQILYKKILSNYDELLNNGNITNNNSKIQVKKSIFSIFKR